MNIKTVGSVCSGIEAASVAWETFDLSFKWFSEIAAFPSKILKQKFPSIPNIGDMNNIPENIRNGYIEAPDLICGGTPCQAFSLAGGQNGLNDDRGNLTLKFVDIIEASDFIRLQKKQSRSVVFWENVEGVLTDKTNAFGCLISSLAGLDDILTFPKWSNAGIIKGKKRNVAWRILDAKYFGLPQQRRRLYVVAGGKDFHPEEILFENHMGEFPDFPNTDLVFEKDGHKFEIFREYSDCLYSAYATKWNGNAAAYNGSLFVVQDHRIRRLSPLECERLMGFPDDYTNISDAKKTNRYQAIGNSWAVPVVKWIGNRIINNTDFKFNIDNYINELSDYTTKISDNEYFVDMGNGIINIGNNLSVNCTSIPENCKFVPISNIISPDVPESIYISPVGCHGIIRRKTERNLSINPRLEEVLLNISSQMPLEDIEKKSMIQRRGKRTKIAVAL